MFKEINGVPLDDSFEEAFGNFIDRKEYDRAEAALFDIVRAAFTAGYLARAGKPLPTEEETPEYEEENQAAETEEE